MELERVLWIVDREGCTVGTTLWLVEGDFHCLRLRLSCPSPERDLKGEEAYLL